MDYDPWKAPLGTPSAFAPASRPPPPPPPHHQGNASTPAASASRTAPTFSSEAGGPPPAKKARTTTADSAATGVGTGSSTTTKGGNNAFDDLLAQEVTLSTSLAGPNSAATAAAGTDATTPSILSDAVKTPPLSNVGTADKAKKPLRVPAALRKAKAREEESKLGAEATASGSNLASSTATALTSGSLHSSTASSALPEGSSLSSSAAAARPDSDLRNRLGPVCDRAFRARDPLELALQTLRARRAQYVQEGRDRLDLLWHVQRHGVTLDGEPTAQPVDRKGKGKDTTDSSAEETATVAGEDEGARLLRGGDGHARILWTFSVVQGGEKDPDEDLDMGSLGQVLADLEFEGLEGELPT